MTNEEKALIEAALNSADYWKHRPPMDYLVGRGGKNPHDILDEAAAAYRRSKEPKPRYRVHNTCCGTAPSGDWRYIADEGKYGVHFAIAARDAETAERICRLLNEAEKP